MKRSVLVLFVGLLATLSASADDLSDQVRRLLEVRLAQGTVMPTHLKLDAGLNSIVDSTTPFEVAEELGLRVRDGQVQVVAQSVDESAVPEFAQWLESSGAKHVVAVKNLVQAFVPPALLGALDEHPLVSYVRKPDYFHVEPRSPSETLSKILVTTEGLQAMNGQAWHSAGYTGQGVRVGVIDSGFQGADALLGTDLPESSRVTGQAFGGTYFYDGEHGTACAEIIYDIAPGIEHLFLGAVSSGVDFLLALDWMMNQGVDVVSVSLAYTHSAPGDGTGILADAISYFSSNGGVFVVSAGNWAQSHWQGHWVDNNGDWIFDFAPGYDTNFFLMPDGSDFVVFPYGTEIGVSLVWNQWSSPTTNLNLYLIGWDGVGDPWIAAYSEDLQSGLSNQLPREQINHTVLTPAAYGVSVVDWLGDPNVDMELLEYVPSGPILQFRQSGGSISEPADAQSAIAVAALDAGSPYPIEPYSSRGPTNGPGGALSGGYIKPDISGFANVSTASFGPRSSGHSFNGTSSACPHVAGAAAVLWSANPGWSNSQVRSYLQSNAIDMGPGGKDNDYGYGRLWLGNPPTSCTYSISPTSASYGANGGSGSFSVSTQAGCAWTASANNNWIHITGGASGTGNGTVSYSVDANGSSSSRTGTITAGGRTFTITQAGATSCTYSISPTSASYGANGGTGSFALTTQAGCTWTATSNNNWIHITGGASGTGSGTVSYSVDANGSSSSRTGTISAADKTFSITQAGATSCTYSISPTSASYGANGGNGTFSVTTQAGCVWTASANNNWIHITGGASGTGSGTVSYSVDANGSSSSRTGTITAGGRTFTITQAGATSCTYSISPTSASYGASGGGGSVSVTTAAGCAWTASSNSGWIHITTGSSGTGSGTVNYSVDANSGSSRTGTMTIAGHMFTVTQAGGGGSGPYYYEVAGIAHAGGAGGSVWRSTLCVTNMSGTTADLTLIYRMSGNTVTRTHILQNNRIKEWEDVAVSLFNQSANTSGAIEIIASVPIMVVARTYNEAPDGTFGQGMPGNDESATLTTGQLGILPQLKKTSAFRTNVGLMNHGSAPCNARIKLYSETGNQLGSTIDTTVPAEQWKQINDVFAEAGVGQCEIGYATVEVLTGGGRIWAYGSVVDNGTGDPTTIQLFIE